MAGTGTEELGGGLVLRSLRLPAATLISEYRGSNVYFQLTFFYDGAQCRRSGSHAEDLPKNWVTV